jgi:hypothetical protein
MRGGKSLRSNARRTAETKKKIAQQRLAESQKRKEKLEKEKKAAVQALTFTSSTPKEKADERVLVSSAPLLEPSG